MFGLTKKEVDVLRRLNNPKKVQDFINKIPMNFDYKKDTCMSPRQVLKKNKCHCIEGALLAAVALRLQGRKPIIVDLEANDEDYDHVIAVFKEDGKFGCITKTNHGVLRYREPVYRDIRELVMSFFHEYTNGTGKKTLRGYSIPVNLERFDKFGWMTSDEDVWYIPDYLTKIKHFKILNIKQIHNLRKMDKIEIKIGKIKDWMYRK
jgi:hypothetical protein